MRSVVVTSSCNKFDRSKWCTDSSLRRRNSNVTPQGSDQRHAHFGLYNYYSLKLWSVTKRHKLVKTTGSSKLELFDSIIAYSLIDWEFLLDFLFQKLIGYGTHIMRSCHKIFQVCTAQILCFFYFTYILFGFWSFCPL